MCCALLCSREKWTLFEEATRVPLMIYHPKSPYKGQHYRLPVELIDIYPTLIDFNGFPHLLGKSSCPQGSKCLIRNGQSLAPVILGPDFKNPLPSESGDAISAPMPMPVLPKRIAVTQAIRCAQQKDLQRVKDLSLFSSASSSEERNHLLSNLWETCDILHREDEVCLMGYSIRTKSFRYTAYLPYNRRINRVYNLTTSEPLRAEIEELYDHREDRTSSSASSLVNRELVNLALLPRFEKKMEDMRQILNNFLRPNQQILRVAKGNH
jgi:hypothetical protein